VTTKLTAIYEKKIRPRAKKTLIGLLVFFAVYTLAGFFALPPALKYVLTKELSKTLAREVTIAQVRTNPYTLSVAVRGLLVKDRARAGTFVSCDELFLNLQSISAVKLALVLKEVRMTKPYARLARNQDLSYNFSDLLETKAPEKKRPFRFSLNNISIENGSIDFVDAPKKTTHTIRNLNIGVPFLSNIPDYVQIFVQPHFQPKSMTRSTHSRGRRSPSPTPLKPPWTSTLKRSTSRATWPTSR